MFLVLPPADANNPGGLNTEASPSPKPTADPSDVTPSKERPVERERMVSFARQVDTFPGRSPRSPPSIRPQVQTGAEAEAELSGEVLDLLCAQQKEFRESFQKTLESLGSAQGGLKPEDLSKAQEIYDKAYESLPSLLDQQSKLTRNRSRLNLASIIKRPGYVGLGAINSRAAGPAS